MSSREEKIKEAKEEYEYAKREIAIRSNMYAPKKWGQKKKKIKLHGTREDFEKAYKSKREAAEKIKKLKKKPKQEKAEKLLTKQSKYFKSAQKWS